MPVLTPPELGRQTRQAQHGLGEGMLHGENTFGNVGTSFPVAGASHQAVQNSRKATPTVTNVPYTPNTMGMFGKSLSTVNTVTNSALMIPQLLSMAGSVFAFIGKIPYLGKPFRSLATVADAPQIIMRTNNVEDVVHTASGAVDKMSGLIDKVMGDGKAADLVSSLRAREEKAGQWAFAKSNSIATSIGGVVSNAFENVGFLNAFAQKRSGKKAELAAKAYEQLQKTATDLSSHFGDAKLDAVKAAFDTAKSHIGTGISGLNHSEAVKALESAKQALAGVKNDKALSASVGKISEGLDNFFHSMSETQTHFQASNNWKDIKSAISSVPGKLKNMKLEDAVWQAGVHAGNAMMAYSNYKQSSTGMTALKDMCQSITGKRPSTFSILFGSGLPETVKEARSQYFKSAITRTISDALGIFINTKYASGTGTSAGMKGLAVMIGVPMLVGKVTEFITSNNQSADLFSQIRDLQAANQPVPTELLAQFIGVTSKNAREAGGVDSKSVQLLAQQYSSEHVPVEAIVKEIESGAFDQRQASLATTKLSNSRGRSQQQPAMPRQEFGAHTTRFNQGMGVPFAFGRA